MNGPFITTTLDSAILTVAHYALELARGHLDDALVVRVGDAEVLRVDVHELELEVANAVAVLALKQEARGVAVVIRLYCHRVVVARAL